MKKDLKYWIWLSSINGLGPRKCMQLMKLFGEPKNIWEISSDELKNMKIVPKAIINQLIDLKIKAGVEDILEKMYKSNIQAITINEEEYPNYLKNIHDPPIVLYVKGRLLKEDKAVAVVGSRKASSYGLKMAETISYELSKCGITVVSGMAKGIDSSAHLGALRAAGRTIAVLGCGLDKIYPVENKELMSKIYETGAVISEYIPGTPPMPQNFPARNRIISGISKGVVVIEANEKSGSLITADFALEQGREVFAVPGNVNSFTSKGTNKLIRDGAKIVTCIEDVLEEINIFRSAEYNVFEQKELEKGRFLTGLNSEERKLAESLFSEPLHVDKIATDTGISIQNVNAILVMLELQGIIEQLPGKIFKIRE